MEFSLAIRRTSIGAVINVDSVSLWNLYESRSLFYMAKVAFNNRGQILCWGMKNFAHVSVQIWNEVLHIFVHLQQGCGFVQSSDFPDVAVRAWRCNKSIEPCINGPNTLSFFSSTCSETQLHSAFPITLFLSKILVSYSIQLVSFENDQPIFHTRDGTICHSRELLHSDHIFTWCTIGSFALKPHVCEPCRSIELLHLTHRLHTEGYL